MFGWFRRPSIPAAIVIIVVGDLALLAIAVIGAAAGLDGFRYLSTPFALIIWPGIIASFMWWGRLNA